MTALSTQSGAEPLSAAAGRLEAVDGNLRASADGALVRLDGGVTLRVAPGAVLYKQRQRTKLWLGASGTVPTEVIVLRSGRVDVIGQDVARAKATRAVLIQAPRKVNVATLGGRMSVVVKPDAVNVVNHSSKALVAIGAGKYTPLPEATVRSVSRTHDSVSRLLQAPNVLLPRELYAAFGQGAELSKLTWQPVEGAAAYAVYIEQLAPAGGAPRRIETRLNELSNLPKLEGGRYSWRVRAIDKYELEGAASAPVSFTVLGVQPANGGYVDPSGNIVAGYDRRVRLTFADGLMMKRGDVAPWVPMPEEIVLNSDEPTSLHLRRAGHTDVVSTRVVAHRVVAHISITPKHLRWPGDKARFLVKLASSNGGPPPAWFKPRLRVRLGVDELDVPWTAQDNLWSAEVPPQPGVGPWVLRVEVEDQYGHSIGRDFVEIAARVVVPIAPPPPPAKDLRAAGEAR